VGRKADQLFSRDGALFVFSSLISDTQSFGSSVVGIFL
jgi:hypothetical protein